MYSKTITYEDWNGVKRTETFYFNLTKAELFEMELTKDGGMADTLTRIIKAKDYAEITKQLKALLLKSYGEKTDDGKHFIKDEERTRMFTYSPAYDVIYCELLSDTEAAAAFANGIMPADIASKMNSEEAKKILQEYEEG